MERPLYIRAMLHASAPVAAGLTVVLAVVALALRTLTWGGAVSGALIGLAVSAAYGLPGLGTLASFFVLGSLATRLGWERKSAEGTAEARGGARDAVRVAGKGAVAGAIAAAQLVVGADLRPAFAGAVAAALADTLGTEIGSLARGQAVRLPSFRRVPRGTPGAVSLQGTTAAAFGALAVAAIAATAHLPLHADAIPWVAAAGLAATLLESVATSVLGRARGPGWVRNLLTTGAGGALAALAP